MAADRYFAPAGADAGAELGMAAGGGDAAAGAVADAAGAVEGVVVGPWPDVLLTNAYSAMFSAISNAGIVK